MTLRRRLAAWLDPETAEQARRYRFLQGRLSEAHRWLGEFWQIEAVIQWAWQAVGNHFRRPGQQPIGQWPSDISNFREALRKRAQKEESQ